MKILITGVAGFIGSNFIHYMIKKYPEYDYIGLDKLTYAGNLDNLSGIINEKNFKFIKADICDAKVINNLFEDEKIELVINFAAESHVDRSIENPGVFLETNIIGTQVLLDACVKHGNVRYHQISTDEVYGDLPLDKPDLKFIETTPINTSSPYSASKASADLLVLAYYRTYKLPITISRCSNNYGPYQFPEKLIPLVINNISNDIKIPVYGEGLNVRDWIYVDDHSKAIDIIIHKGRIGEIYNIGGHSEIKNIDVVKTILSKFNKSDDLISYVTDRKGHDLRYAIDTSKMETEFGWKPEETFNKGIEKTIQWYKENHSWMENITSGEYQSYYYIMYKNRDK